MNKVIKTMTKLGIYVILAAALGIMLSGVFVLLSNY